MKKNKQSKNGKRIIRYLINAEKEVDYKIVNQAEETEEEKQGGN